MPAPVKDLEKLSDKELDAMLSGDEPAAKVDSFDDLSDAELNAKLSEEQAPAKEEVKLSFGEKIADKLTGGMITGGKEIQRDASAGDYGEKAKFYSDAGQGIQKTAKTVGEVGQSIMLTNGAIGLMKEVPVIAKVLGNQKVIQGLVASQETKLANAGIRLSNIQRAAQRYAIEGAVAAQPFDYKSLGDRIKATTISAAISPLMGLTVEGGMGAAVNLMRKVNKFKSAITEGVKETSVGTLRDPRMPAIKQVQDSLSQAEKEASEIGTSSRRQMSQSSAEGKAAVDAVEERAALLRGNISAETKAKTFQIEQSLKQTKDQINTSIKRTDEMLSRESDIAAKSYQSKITGFFRENSKSYGKSLDQVSDIIASNGRLTRQEAFNVLNNAVKRSGSEAEVMDGPIVDEIKSLIQNKYNAATSGVDQGGTIYRQMDDLIPFNEFLGEVRGIWKKAYQTGNRLSQDEIPAAILQSEFGELVSSLPGGSSFKQLQSAYRPVISYMNKAASVLQPYKGEAYTKTAEALVKRYAKGTAAEADKQLIEFMENGTERFAKGLGAISGRARQLGANMKTLSREMGKVGSHSEKRILDIAQEGAHKISKINTMEANAADLIQEESNRRTSLIMQEAAMEEYKTWGRMKQLKGRKMEIENLTSRMQKIKSVAAGSIKLLAGLTSGYLVLRGGSEIANTIGKEQ